MSDMSQERAATKFFFEILLNQAGNVLIIENYDYIFLFSISCLSLDDNI